jgi:hypothetical protein
MIDDSLVFSICTHDPDTGVLTDADSAPSYRIYDGETASPILTGTMAKLDDANTTGFYTESIAVTTGNGFAKGGTYTVYIEATVDSDTGGIAYGFNVSRLLDMAAAYTEPTGAPAANESLAERIAYLSTGMRNKVTVTEDTKTIYDDSGVAMFTKTLSYDGVTYTEEEAT